jgi:hypothetical protein
MEAHSHPKTKIENKTHRKIFGSKNNKIKDCRIL